MIGAAADDAGDDDRAGRAQDRRVVVGQHRVAAPRCAPGRRRRCRSGPGRAGGRRRRRRRRGSGAAGRARTRRRGAARARPPRAVGARRGLAARSSTRRSLRSRSRHGRIFAHVGFRATGSRGRILPGWRRDPDRRAGPRPPRRIHPAWWAAAATFLALLGAAAFRATPERDDRAAARRVRLVDRHDLAALSVNLALFGITAPFAAALMERFGVRRVVSLALLMVAAGSGLTVFMTASWQLVAAVGGGRRARHGLDGDGAGRDRGRALVRRPARAGLRHPHRGERDRAADLPADDRARRAGRRLARRVADDQRVRPGRRPGRAVLPARAPAPTSASCPTAARPRTSWSRCARARPASRSGRCCGPCAYARSGCSPAASSSAARRRPGWSSSTSCRPRTTTACR